jgi:chromosome segregation ATPase
VVRFQHEFEEKVKHVALLQSELKEKSEQVIHFQHEFEEKSQRAAQFKTEAEERSRNVTQLQRDLEEKSWQAAQLQRESDQQSELVEQLKDQLLTENDRVRRASEKLLDARWEALTLRGTLLRRTESAGSPFSRILELETRVEAATSERDQLRKMLTSLQKNLELEQMTGQSKQDEFRATQAQLKATIKDLRSAHKQMDRLRENISRKLILPFGRSQRKFQQLISDRRADD